MDSQREFSWGGRMILEILLDHQCYVSEFNLKLYQKNCMSIMENPSFVTLRTQETTPGSYVSCSILKMLTNQKCSSKRPMMGLGTTMHNLRKGDWEET